MPRTPAVPATPLTSVPRKTACPGTECGTSRGRKEDKKRENGDLFAEGGFAQRLIAGAEAVAVDTAPALRQGDGRRSDESKDEANAQPDAPGDSKARNEQGAAEEF